MYQKQIVDGDVIHTDTYYPVKTREVTKKTTHKEAPHYEGIGPQDESGLPVGLRAVRSKVTLSRFKTNSKTHLILSISLKVSPLVKFLFLWARSVFLIDMVHYQYQLLLFISGRGKNISA